MVNDTFIFPFFYLLLTRNMTVIIRSPTVLENLRITRMETSHWESEHEDQIWVPDDARVSTYPWTSFTLETSELLSCLRHCSLSFITYNMIYVIRYKIHILFFKKDSKIKKEILGKSS